MAWVTYSSPKAAEGAVSSLNGKDFGGRAVDAAISNRGTEEAEKKREEKQAARNAKRAETQAARAAAGGNAAPSTPSPDRVVIRNVPKGTTSEVLRAALEKTGPLSGLKRMKAPGMYMATFGSPAAAAKATTLTTLTLGGESVAVKVEAARGDKPASGGAAARAPKTAGETVFRNVSVGGFPSGTTGDEVKAHFASCGRIIGVKDTKTGDLFIVQFEETSSAEKALKLNGASFKGTKLVVEKARRQPTLPGTGGGAAPSESRVGRKRTSGDEEEEGGARAKREPKPKADLSSIVWVGNLRAGITEAEVRRTFSSFGQVAEGDKAVLVTQVQARAGKEGSTDGAYAYITFTSAESARKAVAADGKDGMKIQAASAPPRVGRRRGPRREE